VVRAGFAQRRKMLRRSLEDVVRPGAFAATGVQPTARAEELGLDEWERLARWQPDPAAPNPSAGDDPGVGR
jgi:16S rRNA (adenine1518-N6/adenine1519-N6)-dimethyltransferase